MPTGNILRAIVATRNDVHVALYMRKLWRARSITLTCHAVTRDSRDTRLDGRALCLQMAVIRLYPPLFEEGQHVKFRGSGRTLCAAQSPRDNSVAVFATNAVCVSPPMSASFLITV
jgi:hypothetical protein